MVAYIFFYLRSFFSPYFVIGFYFDECCKGNQRRCRPDLKVKLRSDRGGLSFDKAGRLDNKSANRQGADLRYISLCKAP